MSHSEPYKTAQAVVEPIVSVVTVTLNAGDDLVATVASVDEQVGSAFEHVVKDGGSTDGSLDSLTSTSIRQVIVCADKGIYDAMNQALASVRGHYVFFLNAGDVFASRDSLAAMIDALRAHRFPALMYCDYKTPEIDIPILNPRTLTAFYLYRTMLCHQSYTIQRKLLAAQGGFDTSLRVAADYDALVRVARKRNVKIAHAPVILTSYRGQGYSTTAEARRILVQDVKEVRRRYFTRTERLGFALLYAATMPGIRRRVAGAKDARLLRTVYRAVVNFIQGRY